MSPDQSNPPRRQRPLGPTYAAVMALCLLAGAGCGADAATEAGAVPNGTGGGSAGGSGTTGGTGTTNGTPSGGTTPTGPFATTDKLAVKNLTALPLNGCVPSVYNASIAVGNESFRLLVDSGSSTTAVATETCPTCSSLTPVYDVDGAVTQNNTAETQYGDNSKWSGIVYTDTMAAYAGETTLATPVDVSFAGITQEESFFTRSVCPGTNDADNAYQGILGLGPDSLLEPHTTSWMAALQSKKPLVNDAYAVQICDLGGRMWFGGYDPAFVASEPQYTPMVQTGTVGQYYGVKVADMGLGGTSLGLSASTLGSTVVDTGTSAFIVPTAVFEKVATTLTNNAAFKANFPPDRTTGSIVYTGGCMRSAKGLTPDKLDAVLPAMSISFPNASGSGNITLNLKATESYLFAVDLVGGGNGYCFAMTYSSGTPIFGSTMMREHVVVFDRANEQVGFVAQAPCNSGLFLAKFDD